MTKYKIRTIIYLYFICIVNLYSQQAPLTPNTFPAPLYPRDGSPLLGNEQFVRLTNTLHISDDKNIFTFESNIGLVLFTLFFSLLFSLFGVNKLFILLMKFIFKLDKDFEENKFIKFFSLIFTTFLLLAFVLPKKTVINMREQKILQKNIIFQKGDDISFDMIKELQIIPKTICYDDEEKYLKECGDSYELNIVLNDDSRINITDHFNYDQISYEATYVANKLNIPLLDYKVIKREK